MSPGGGAEIRHILSSPPGDLTHAVCPAGHVSPTHQLPELDEAYFILAGEGEIWRGTDERSAVTRLRPGRWVQMPAGMRFQFRARRGATGLAGAQGVQHHVRRHPRANSVGPLTTTVLIAGDDADAKAALADVVTSGGLNAIDAGPLKRARELEAVGFLQLTLAANEKVSWTGGFGVVA